MDNHHPSAIPRPSPSGLPRPTSRLPVLKSSSSQSQLRQPSAPTDQLRKKASVPSIPRASLPAQQPLQKKASRASLVRSNTPSTAAPAPAPSSRASLKAARRVSGIPSFAPPRASTTSTASTVSTTSSSSTHAHEPVFKRPFARPPSRQTKAAPQSTTSSTNREDDALGSLDGFRSASRASSRAGSRAGFRDQDPESDYVLVSNDPSPEPEVDDAGEPLKRKSRPSLSDRTIESLSNLPSSPARSKGRRRSSFFNADNSMPPPLRPASAMSSNGGSRPTTSDGSFNGAPATPSRLGTKSSRLSMTVPGKRAVSASVTPAATPSRISSVSRPVSTIKKQPLLHTQNLQATPKPRPLSNSKSMVARTPKSRPSLGGVFGQAVSPPGTGTATVPTTPSRGLAPPVKKTPDTSRRISSSSLALREQIAKAKAARKPDTTEEVVEQSPKAKAAASSNALREQIAKAREAARRAKAESERTSTPPRDAIVPSPDEIATFDFGLDDPFNQRAKGSKSLLRKRIDGARADGRLNIAAMDLKEIPEDVLQMYKYDPKDTSVAWGEVVDMSSIMAADNELESLPEAMFPDIDPQEAVEMDEGGPQFGGVQSIDVHGNALLNLPLGLRRLSLLTKLNLSRNKLTLDVFEIISRITPLRELKLAENDLHGDLPSSLGKLTALEILELQDNKLTTLPEDTKLLTALRSLNVSNNQMQKIPAELFETGLISLIAAHNRLDGVFFAAGSVPHLQDLNISNNAVQSLCPGETVEMPALKYLNIATNRIDSLPIMESWVNLHTLLVAENKLTTLPDSIYGLPVHTIDLTANNLVQLDARLSKLPLKHLTVAANPLRERKFLTMPVEDIQRDLAAKLQPDEPINEDDAEDVPGLDASASAELEPKGWQVTPSGTLDLTSKGLANVLDETKLDAVADNVRQLYLQQNGFESIPTILSRVPMLTILDISKNNIETVFTAPVELLKLRELRLAGNKMTDLSSLTTRLTAPNLQTLDVSANRLLGSVPCLRESFPELISLIASDNSICEVSAEALTGLKIVNLSNNDIERLEPHIGLLSNTLTSLNVEGNKFRVPNYQVLQKGTESVLTWLRDKIPRESWKSDATEFFDADDGGTF